MDTDIDTSQHDAELRAAPLYTAQRAAEVRGVAPRSAPGAEWTLWSSHHAYTAVQLRESHEDGAPEPTQTTVYQRWALTVTPTGRDGWTSQPDQVTALAVLTRASETQPWRLDTLTLG